MSHAIPIRAAVALGAVTLGLVGASACSRFSPTAPVVVFAISGRHATLQCEECHGPPPFSALPTDCVSCHENDRKSPTHYAGQTCNAAGCHSPEDNSWSDVFGGTGGETGGGFHDFLPLEGSHDQDCTACHADTVNYLDRTGDSEYCWNCHEDDRQPGGHYADVYDPLEPLYRWDCGPCHEPSAWSTSPYEHPARVPHAAVDSTCTPKVETTWVSGCDGCHPVNTAAFVCYACHPTSHDQSYAESTCLGCHVSGQPENCDSLQ